MTGTLGGRVAKSHQSQLAIPFIGGSLSVAAKMLVLGAGGQLGSALCELSGVVGLPSSLVDVTQEAQIERCLQEYRPEVLINAAAFTAVDAAETQVETCKRVNRDAVRLLAVQCRRFGVRFVQISTDFVFDGSSSRPISVDAPANPQSVYGRSKWEGEIECREHLGEAALIVRTAWLYGAGHRNFVSTMLRLMSERDSVCVVADQVGSPTWTGTLAAGVVGLVNAGASGTHHLTDAGVATWYDFAVAIQEFGQERGLLESSCEVIPIRTEDYPTPARRPAYSVLDKTLAFELLGASSPHWRVSLKRCLADWHI